MLDLSSSGLPEKFPANQCLLILWPIDGESEISVMGRVYCIL